MSEQTSIFYTVIYSTTPDNYSEKSRFISFTTTDFVDEEVENVYVENVDVIVFNHKTKN